MNKAMITFVLCCCMISCIKDEAPNNECDIESAWVEGAELEKLFYKPADMRKENISSTETSITFIVRSMAMVPTEIPVNFKITDKAYKVAFTEPILPKSKFSYENVDTLEGGFLVLNKYHQFYELNQNGEKQRFWASGNAGFALSLFSGAGPKQFPTYMSENGFEGNGVRLKTMYAGDLGKGMGKPIAAGNLYLGRFMVEYAAMDPLKATEFGVQWDRDPVRITGYYKYKPGPEFTNVKMEVIPDRIDEASIYAVFYNNIDPNGSQYFLYGEELADLDKIIDNPQVYKVARVSSLPPTDQWTRFEMFFEGRDAPEELVANKNCNLAIVFSSSKNGAQFEGAIGSTLYIDEVEVSYDAIGMTVLTFGMAATAKAGGIDSLQLKVRAGYNIGGTSPIPLPETIRSIDSYSLTPSFMVGIDAMLPLNEKWGITAGLHFENKGMKAEVTTKSYHMEVIKGDSHLSGV